MVRRLTLPGALAAEVSAWDRSALEASARTPMQTDAWLRACAEIFSRDGDLRIVVLEDARGVAAVAPLVRGRSVPAVNELLGVRELSEPSDLIYRDEQALAALIKVVSRDRTPLMFQRVPATSPSVEAIRKGYRGKAVVVIRPGNNCPHLALAPGGKDPDQLLSSRLRSDLRRAQRKAESQGKTTVEIHAPRTAREFLPLYEQALQVEAAGWKGRGGSAVAKNELQRAFFSRYGELASEEGTLRLAFLRLNGVLAAMQYAVQWNGSFWLLKIGYDESFSKCSPGMLLIQHTLRYAAEQGLHSYEFLGTAETWTQRWTTAERNTVRIAVYPFGPAGMWTLGRDLFRSVRRKVAGRIEGMRGTKAVQEGPEATPSEGGAQSE